MMEQLASPEFWLGLGQITLINIVLSGDNAVVIAMGPWSVLASRWLSLPAVHGVKGHSLVFGPGGRKLDGALFLEVDDSHGTVLTPEIFPRADGTVWACAISSTPWLLRAVI